MEQARKDTARRSRTPVTRRSSSGPTKREVERDETLRPSSSPSPPAASTRALGGKRGHSKDQEKEKDAVKIVPTKRGVSSREESNGEEAEEPETIRLERKRLQVANELRKVEQQISDLETTYLETSSPYGNAVRGYEGFLGGLSQANRKIQVKPEERLFSFSSSSAPVR